MLDIKVKINPLHNANYYLDVNFDGINMENAKEVFQEFARELDKPLQIMLSSEDTEKIETLKAAGFVTLDSRVKERKKYGLKGARRAPQYSKR